MGGKTDGRDGKPELANDPRFDSEKNRIKNNKQVTEIIEKWLTTFEKVADVALLLQSYRILAAPVLSAGQAIEDPYFKNRDMLREVEHGILGKIKVLNSPLKFTNSEASVDGPPPAHPGDHTQYVLKNVLQMKDEEIFSLKESGVVAAAGD
jgi:crotonobetainyl-CoA:carnitine CoA-transferase CaiB-like acyl-CoA transferase